MAPSEGVDGVEEDEVTRGNQEKEHTGRTGIHSWRERGATLEHIFDSEIQSSLSTVN